MTPRRVGGHDDETPARPSPEAQKALDDAHRAQRTTEAALPAVEQTRERVRRVLAGDAFAALMRDVLREAARRA